MELKLREFRKSKGMTQDDLAAQINSTKRVIGAYERRETSIPLEVAYEITEVLGCTLDELCGRKVEHSFIDPKQAALNGYYESMNETGRTTLVESARLMSDGNSVRIEKEGVEHVGIQTAMGA